VNSKQTLTVDQIADAGEVIARIGGGGALALLDARAVLALVEIADGRRERAVAAARRNGRVDAASGTVARVNRTGIIIIA